MQTIIPYVTRFLAAIIGIIWCYIEPSINYIAVCAFALLLDCYTAWRLNRRIYSRYREAIKKDPRCKIDGKLKSKKMAKMVQDFSVLIMAIFLATLIDTVILDYMNPLHLANYLAAIYCSVQFISVLENESTCNGAAWAKVMQKIVADKTERHFNVKMKDLIEEEEEIKGKDPYGHKSNSEIEENERSNASSGRKSSSPDNDSTPSEEESASKEDEDDADKSEDDADKSKEELDEDGWVKPAPEEPIYGM